MTFYTPRPNHIRNSELMGHKELLSTRHRVIALSGVIEFGDVDACNLLMAMDAVSHEPIKLIIASPGGLMDVALNIHDTIKAMTSPVYTLARFCASGATILLAAGTPGHRYILPNSRVMLHSPSGGLAGHVEDVRIQHRELERLKEVMVDILIGDGATRERDALLSDIERDKWMGADEAIEYGLVDHVMTPETMKEWLKGE